MEENEEEVVGGTMTKRDLFAERCFIVTMTIHARCCRLVYGAISSAIVSNSHHSVDHIVFALITVPLYERM